MAGLSCAPWVVLQRVILADWQRRTGDHLKPVGWLRGPASRDQVERQYAALIAQEAKCKPSNARTVAEEPKAA
jgi:hypothetical protein